MRKAIKEYLVKALQKGLADGGFTPKQVASEDVPVDVCFQIHEEQHFSFFLHMVCSDESDSVQTYLAWNRGVGYPVLPDSMDLSLPRTESALELLCGDAAEIPLASLDQNIPLVWNLDVQYGAWKAKLDALMAEAGEGRLEEDVYGAHLLSMPKKCSVAEAKFESDKAIKQIVAALQQQKPRLALIANRGT